MEQIASLIRDVVLTITGIAVAAAAVHKEMRESREAKREPPADPE